MARVCYVCDRGHDHGLVLGVVGEFPASAVAAAGFDAPPEG